MCGLGGIINKAPRRFDYSTFCTLGISNDVRGGDSCGVFIDGKYEYGVDKNKLFTSYFLKSTLINNTKESQIALVHCRKASIGSIGISTAQPVVITKNNKVDFVLLHNGTIYNYEELAEKYIPNVDIKGMTDSQVMAHIFYHKGYDVLSEYNGGAVFVIVDYRKGYPETFFFKGESKLTKYAKEIKEERPLYYSIDKSIGELVFSSIWPYIAAQRPSLEVFSLPSNTLYKFDGEALTPVKEYSRENCIQSRMTYFNYNVDDYDYYLPNKYSSNLCFISVDLVNNLYSYKGKRMHDLNYVTSFGRVESKPYQDNTDIWFFMGVALKNKSCFKFLESLLKESKLSSKDFFKKFENVIRFLSIDGIFSKDSKCYKAISPTDNTLFNGIYQPIGAISRTEYIEGVKNSCKYNGKYTFIKEILQQDFSINFKEIREQCKLLMK